MTVLQVLEDLKAELGQREEHEEVRHHEQRNFGLGDRS